VNGGIIEKFAYHGVVSSWGWSIEHNEIRFVHSHGLRALGNTKVIGNYIHDAGNMGIFARGQDLVFRGNELARNNYLHFGMANGNMWHAGAVKIVESDGIVVRNNYSHDNVGDGWWFDGSNINSLIVGNRFSHNSRFGLFYEISFTGMVRGNVFAKNKGGGLWVNTSKDLEVKRNAFRMNSGPSLGIVGTDRGSSPSYGRHELANFYAHNNVFRVREGFVGAPYGSQEIYESNNRFESNDYYVSDRSAEWWRWRGDMLNWRKWRSHGQDPGSELRVLEAS
jgi:nitrous oxidase accessory protein NosD